MSTRNVNNIAIDPIDETYFAAGGSTDDPSITVWDRRWLSQGTTTIDDTATLSIKASTTSAARTSVWSLRFSGLKRGQLAMCTSTGEVRILNIASNQVTPGLKQDYPPTNSFGGQSWSGGSYILDSCLIRKPATTTQASKQRVVSFDWLPDNIGGQSPSIIALRADKTIEEYTCSGPSVLALDALGGLATGRGLPETVSSMAREKSYHSEKLRLSKSPAVQSLLESTRLHHDRCKQGYLLDCTKNSRITSEVPSLAQLWQTIAQLRSMAEKGGMVYDSADLAFVGVHGIWSEVFGSSPQRRLSPAPTRPTDAIQGLIERRELPPFEGERTDYAEHRQLCLAVCGWKFTAESLEGECQELIERGLHYQAVTQAVLHGAKHLALNLLRSLIRSKTIPNIGLGALLAADALNDDQQEMTRWMAADTTDTALKALLTYLETGDWRDVMKTSYLNLGYRLTLGLKYLNDTELNGFIQSETARATRNGDPEGVLLTGLTEQSMDLFQRYIVRTGDVQTAVLATAYTNPLYVNDPRWEAWKETYFMHLQAWKAFSQRAKFTVEHNRLSRTREGRCLVEPTTVQVKIHCIHCRSEIRRPLANESVKVLGTPAANAGVICLTCGRSMPRCSVCTLWLGAPDSYRHKPVSKPVGPDGTDSLGEQMLVFCTKCGHGSHARHAQEWFASFNVCPSPACGCDCNDRTPSDAYSLADLFKRM